MSLWPIKIVNNIIQYELCDDNPGPYAPTLCSVRSSIKNGSPTLFISSMSHRMTSWLRMHNSSKKPGRVECFKVGMGRRTGDFIKRSVCGIWPLAWHHNATRGSYNKLFDLDLNGCPEEVNWSTLLWENPLWKRTNIINLLHAVVNLQDNLWSAC